MDLCQLPFSVWVDADSCPVPIRELVCRFAKRLQIPVVFVANRPIPMEADYLFSMRICPDSADAADDYIVAHIQCSDLAITRDIPLAARLVEKKITVLNDRGILYTEKNIQERLAIRNLNLHLFESGISPERTTRFGKKETNNFANALDRELQKKIRCFKT